MCPIGTDSAAPSMQGPPGYVAGVRVARASTMAKVTARALPKTDIPQRSAAAKASPRRPAPKERVQEAPTDAFGGSPCLAPWPFGDNKAWPFPRVGPTKLAWQGPGLHQGFSPEGQERKKSARRKLAETRPSSTENAVELGEKFLAAYRKSQKEGRSEDRWLSMEEVDFWHFLVNKSLGERAPIQKLVAAMEHIDKMQPPRGASQLGPVIDKARRSLEPQPERCEPPASPGPRWRREDGSGDSGWERPWVGTPTNTDYNPANSHGPFSPGIGNSFVAMINGGYKAVPNH